MNMSLDHCRFGRPGRPGKFGKADHCRPACDACRFMTIIPPSIPANIGCQPPASAGSRDLSISSTSTLPGPIHYLTLPNCDITFCRFALLPRSSLPLPPFPLIASPSLPCSLSLPLPPPPSLPLTAPHFFSSRSLPSTARYAARLKQLRLPTWSHHLWPIVIHDVLNSTHAVRFKVRKVACCN